MHNYFYTHTVQTIFYMFTCEWQPCVTFYRVFSSSMQHEPEKGKKKNIWSVWWELNRFRVWLCVWPTDLSRRSPAHVFGPGGCVLDALHLLLVLVPLAIRVLFGLLQSRLQSFDAVHGGPQPLLHLGDFTAEVGVVPQQLREEAHVSGGVGPLKHHREGLDERREPTRSPAYEPWTAAPGCSPGSWSSACGRSFPRNSESRSYSVRNTVGFFSVIEANIEAKSKVLI